MEPAKQQRCESCQVTCLQRADLPELGDLMSLKIPLDVRRLVGYLPETVPLYNDMTVYSYLKYMADLRHLPDG